MKKNVLYALLLLAATLILAGCPRPHRIHPRHPHIPGVPHPSAAPLSAAR